METLNPATPGNVNFDSITADTPLEVVKEVLINTLQQIQISDKPELEWFEKLATIKEILPSRVFTRVIKSVGFTTQLVKKYLLRWKGATYLSNNALKIADPSLLEAIGRINDKRIASYLQEDETQANIQEGIKRFRKEVLSLEKLPKIPEEAIHWKGKPGTGRKLSIQIQETKIARKIAEAWVELKGILPVEEILRQVFSIFGSQEVDREVEVEVEVQDSEPGATTSVEEPPTATETQPEPVEVKIEEPPKPVRRITTPDAWKKGWNVGERCLPIYKTTFAAHKLYEWTKGEFPIIDAVRGEVGAIQLITLLRADGERYETYGNWVMEAPITNDEIACEYYLRKYRINFKLLLNSKATNDEDGMMTGRCNLDHFGKKLMDWGDEHPEYLEYIYSEKQLVQSQTNLELTGQ